MYNKYNNTNYNNISIKLKNKFLLTGIALISSLVSELHAQKLPHNIKKEYEMVWNDEFSGKELDLTKWSHRSLNDKRVHAYVRAENSFLDGKGNCVIKFDKSDEEYKIGQIATHHSYLTRYGYFECRAKMNKQEGPHIAFWLQTPTMGTGKSPQEEGAEIDIFEYHLKAPKTIWHTVHHGGYGEGHKQVGSTIDVEGIEDGFHTFGLEWTPTEYIFYIDGKETWRTSDAVSQVAEYMILSVECSGFGGDYTKAKELPDSVVYDYVRVYKKK